MDRKAVEQAGGEQLPAVHGFRGDKEQRLRQEGVTVALNDKLHISAENKKDFTFQVGLMVAGIKAGAFLIAFAVPHMNIISPEDIVDIHPLSIAQQ
jgi:hypothetical protein